MTDSITTPLGVMWLEDGVLWHRLEGTLRVSPEDAAAVVRAVHELTGGTPVPAIVDIRNIAYAPHEARMAFAGSEEESGETATALIVEQGASSAMARVFTTVTKPKRPVAIFENEEDAIAWVKALSDA